MQELLEQYQKSEITFGQFYKKTEKDWRKLANYVYAKMGWRLQGSADLDDVLQEILMSIPVSVEAYDSARGSMKIKGFVVYRAVCAGRRFISAQCGCKHRSTDAPKTPQMFADMSEMAMLDPDQEFAASISERREQLCRTMVDHIVMDRLLQVGASVQAITDVIYDDDEQLRKQLQLQNHRTAYRLVRKITNQFVERADLLAA